MANKCVFFAHIEFDHPVYFGLAVDSIAGWLKSKDTFYIV